MQYVYMIPWKFRRSIPNSVMEISTDFNVVETVTRKCHFQKLFQWAMKINYHLLIKMIYLIPISGLVWLREKNHDSWQKGLFDYDTRSIIGYLEGYLPIIKPKINSNIHGHSWHIRKIYTDHIDLLRRFTYRNNSWLSANKHTCILTSQVYQRTSITQYKTWLVMPLTELYSSSLQYFHWLTN